MSVLASVSVQNIDSFSLLKVIVFQKTVAKHLSMGDTALI